MLLDNKPYTLDRVVRIGIAAGLIWGLIWLLGTLSDVLIPFAAALLLAYLINPLIIAVQKKVPHRTSAVFISLGVLLLLGAALCALLIPLIMSEIRHMGRILSDLVNNSDLAARAARVLPPDLWEAMKEYASSEKVQEFFHSDNFWVVAETAARKILPGMWGIISGAASFLFWVIGLAVVGLYLVFLLLDFQNIREGWTGLIPPPLQQPVTEFVGEFNAAMNRYFRGQAAVASIVGILFAVGFQIIGLPLGILLGLFIGLLNMVPYLQVIGLIPAFLLSVFHALETGHSLWMVVGLTGLVFVVVQTIQDTILVPKIMGKVTGLSPVWILLSLSVWGKLLGFFGLLIAIPLTCLLLAYYKRYLAAASHATP